MKKPKVILFAGPPASGKSQLATYLSWNLGLPMFSNDAVRLEIKMNAKKKDQSPSNEDYFKLQEKYLNELAAKNRSFIYDASVDRSWPELKKKLTGFDTYIISLDFNDEFIKESLRIKRYYDTEEKYQQWIDEHKSFVNKYSDEINLTIDDGNFLERNEIVLKAVAAFLKN